jgi:hypothetical protein
MFFYELFLTLHNLGRWLVVGFALWAIVRAFRGWLGQRQWAALDDRAGLLYTIMIDTQVLLGIILYFFFSADSNALFRNFGAAMSNPTQRFFGLEHWFLIVIAMGLAHVGRAVSRKAGAAVAKHKRAALWFTASFVLILIGIPWPFMKNVARPFFRLFGIVF